MAKDLSWDELSTTNPTELSWDSLSVEPPKPKSRTWGDVAGDIGVTALKGAIGLPQALVGLADFPTGGIVGKTLEDIGYRPNEASKQLDDLYSDPQKAANRKVAEAEGFTGTLAAHLQNPSTIATTVGESVPQILGGAGVARGLMKAFPKVAAWAAGALGEGIMGAGSAEEQTRAESADGLTTAKQGMAALASGAGTAAFGMAGGKLAGSKLGQRLGLADVDTMLASGKFTPSTAGFFKAVAGSGISEGVLEEMPQSAWEQMLQNYAQEKPLTEGMGKAMASGLVAGAAMGGAGGGFNAAMAPKPANPAVPPVAPPADPLQLGNTPDPMISFPDGTVARRSEVDQYIANLPEDQQVAARAKLSGFAPQKATIADIGAAPNMDDAIAAFTQVVSAPVDLAPDISDAQEFADLVQSEARNQQVMLAQMDQDRIKQAQLDQIPAIAAEQNVTQEALQRAAALDAPTAMGSAFSKLFDKTIGAEPEARETAPAPVPAPKPVPEPRIVARDPGMLAMPRELAELRATMNGGEVVRFANINKDTGAPNGKFAYTVLEDGSKPSLARVANAAPPASVVDQRLTPVSKRTESTNEKAPEAIEASPPAQTSQAEVIEPNFEAAKALIKQQKAATGNKSKENLVRIKLRQLAAKTPINHGKTVSALDIAATRLGMGEGKLKGLEFAPEEQPQAPVEPAQVATETVAKPRKKPAGGKTLRSKAYDKNPLLTFLATHGLFHDKAQPNSHKSEFSPDKGIMVMGYGPVFKKTGKRLDALTQNAIEEGYLPKDGTEAQLRELVRRAVAGEKISPLYAEGVAEQLAEQTFSEHLAQQQEAAQDDDYDPFQPLDELGYEIEDALSAGRSDLTPALQNEVDALLLQAEDVGIDIDQIKSDAATETEKGSQDDYLSATKQRLEAAITGRAANSNGGSTEQDGGQGRGQATVTGSAESRGENDDRQEQSGSQEGLTSPTREDVLAQQDRADAAKKAEEKAAADAANRAKADAERGEFTLTGSDRAADVGAAGGQQDIFSSPAAEATAILDAADVTGKERIDVLKDVKKGDITPDELKAAYPAKEPAAKIEDAGAKIGGARKDRWKERGLDLNDLDSMSESEGAEMATKANVWKPDYEAMAEAAEPVTAAMVKTVYDQLAAKPKTNTPEGRRNYVTMMQAVRKAYLDAKSPDDVKNAGQKIKAEIGLYSADQVVKAKAREVLFSVYKGRSDPFILSYNELSKAKKMVEDGFPAKGEPWKKRLSIRQESGYGGSERGIEILMRNAAEAGTPLTREEVIAPFWRVSDKNGKALAYLSTKADAEAAAKSIYERDMKGKDAEKPEPKRPHLDDLTRENLAQRIDRDVTANDFVSDFGFRGIEFGNWAAQDERQRIINMAYDGLMDLAEIMGVPPKAMSLNGTLGMAFGARGGGKFAAHYEPGKLVINMTKLQGGGSMAHEFAHALDHYFGELNKPDAYTTAARGASGWYTEDAYKGVPRTRMEKIEGKWANVTKMRLDNLRPEMAAAFDNVMSALFSGQETKAEMVRAEELRLERNQTLADRETDPQMKAVYLRGVESQKQQLEELRKDPEDKLYPKGRSKYAGQAQALSGKSASGYWLRPTEMFARAFESWVFDKVVAMGARSDYLVHGVEEDRFAGGEYKGNPYPTGEERANINAAFDRLASTIQTKETDKGVAMFSRAQSETEALQAISENDDLFQYEKSDKNTVEGVAKDINPAITVRKLSNIPGETRYILTTPDGNTHRMMVRPFNPYADKETGTLYGYNLDKNNEMTDVVMERPGKNSEAVEGKDDVYIDVSLMQPGQYGAQIYSIAQNYAHNAGKIFIGDPAGLSDKAMKRRVENMLSSALKFGTTEHLAPHPRQVKGDSSIGVPALDWTYGDDLANIKSLVNVSNAIYGPSNPVTFEPRTGQFLDSEGGVLDDDAISLIDGIRRTGKDGVGLSTAKRNAVLSAILREESQANGGNGSTGRGLLDRLMEVGVQYPVSTHGIFYSRGERSNTGLTPTQFTAELSKAFGSKVAEKLQAKGVVVPLADQSKLPAHVVPFLRDGDIIYGFYDPKTDRTYAVLENLTSEMVKGLTLHEVGVHYGFKSMLGDAKYANVMQRLDVMRRAGSKTVKEAYKTALDAFGVSGLPGVRVGESVYRYAYSGSDSLAINAGINKLLDKAEVVLGAPVQGRMVPGINQQADNSSLRAANELSNLLVSQPAIAQNLGSLDVKTQNIVLSLVRSVIQDSKVFKSVVEFIPIDMMDMLKAGKFPAKVGLHNLSVDVSLNAVDMLNPIPATIDVAGRIAEAVSRFARFRTKDSALGVARESDEKINLTLEALTGNHFTAPGLKMRVTDDSLFQEELAYLVQNNNQFSIVKEIIARIKAFLYTEFGIGGKYLNEADLTMLARAAVDHASRLEDGGSAVPAFMRDIKEPVTNPNDVVGNQGGRSADDTTPGGQTELVRNTDEFVSPIFSPEQVAKALDENRWLDRGLKLGRGQKIYRGVSEKTGRNTANFGRGLYTTTDMSEARQYGRVTEMVATDLPQNPLRFSDEGKFREWESYVGRELLGFRRIADFDAKHGTPDRWIPALDTSIDGIQIGTGPGAFFVKFPNESTAPDSGGAMFSRAGIVGQTNRQHTPEQLRAMKNVGFDVEAPTLKERAQALYKDAGKKLAQGIVDQFAPVKDLDKNAYGLLRLAKGASGAFEAFLQGGKLKLTDGVYDFDDSNKGGVIDKLLIPLQGEHHDFMRWVAANRAERLQGEGKENLFSAQDIADLKTLASGTADFDYTVQTGPAKGRVTRDRTLIYADANRVFNEFNKNVLDMAEQSGLIDGASRKVWEHEFYVPFYRVADEDGGGVRGMSVKGSVLRQQAFKELKGGKNALNADLLDNTLMNWAHLLDASAKNRAAKATIEAAERMGVATGGDQATLAQMGASIHNKHGVVWFMDGGQKRYSLIDKEGDGPYLMTAINALEYAGMRNPVMNAMGAMKHALTVGVTASPFFKIRNLIRDSVQAIGTGNLSYNPAKNITEGWKLTDPKSDAYFRLLAGGGTIHFGTMLEGSEAKRVQALVESGVDDATILGDDRKVKAFYRKYIEPGITAYSELGNRGEAINRASLYDQLRKQGVNHADASLQARDLMDFSMQGSFTSIRFLTQVVPFLNARLQGLYKLGRAAKEDPARFSMVLGSVAAISLGLLAAYSDDDDWKKREDWDRNNFWWFKVGGTAFRIPKPFEIGAIATLAERGFELAFDKEMTNKRFMGQVMTLLGDNLSMNPVPQLVKPMLDVYANKDSFSGRPIETMGMEKLKSEYRFTDRTSMAARAASTSLNAVTGLVGKEALSPVQIDSMLRGYFGWLGSFIVGAGDKIARPATDQKDQASPDYWKVATGSIVSDLGDAPSRYVSAMYDQAKTLEEAYGTYRMLVKEGKTEEAKEFMVDHRDELTRYKRVEAVKRTEAKFNERIRMIERSALSSDAKRDAIRKVKEQKDRVARQLAPA